MVWGTKRAEEAIAPAYPCWIQVAHEIGTSYKVIWWQQVSSKAEEELVRSVYERLKERIEAIRQNTSQ